MRFYTLKEGEALHVKTCTQVPYEEWMEDGAAFYITTQKATYKPNCIHNYPGEEYICDIPYLKEPLVVNPVLVPVPVEAALENTRVLRTKLFYPVNVTKKVDNYLENAEALALLAFFFNGWMQSLRSTLSSSGRMARRIRNPEVRKEMTMRIKELLHSVTAGVGSRM